MNSSTSLATVLNSREHWLVLTGAGCSTESGLGDYRDRSGQWKRPQPITGQTFRHDELARKRYWARGFVGWPHFASAKPTAAHQALVKLQHQIHAPTLITQNVDYLHQSAGHNDVVDLHGLLSEVICLSCQEITHRHEMQSRLAKANPWLLKLDASYAPDGDADLNDDSVHWVKVPNCRNCEGLLKPHVVFFGENVPKERVQYCFDSLADADGLLVVGSSLMVYSGFRFCRRAAALNLPIVIVNNGVTRADEIASVKFSGECGELLSDALVELAAM